MSGDGLHEVLGVEPPAGVLALPEADRLELAQLIRAARAKQAADLDAAFTSVLKHVPFPVRPIARRMLRG